MMNKVAIILPKLNDAEGNMEKEWFVYYSVLNPATGRLKRFKDYKGLGNQQSSEDRYKHAAEKIKELSRKLQSGWDPFNKEGVIYTDSLEYHAIAKQQGRDKEVKYNIDWRLSKFLSDHKKSWRTSTYSTYQSKLRKFSQWLAKKKLAGIDIQWFTPFQAEAFLAHIRDTKSFKTRNEYLVLLRSVFKYSLKKGTPNPFQDITKLKTNKPTPQYFKAGAQMVLQEAFTKEDPQAWIFQQCIYYTYIRPKELRFLKLENIDLIDGCITIPGDIAKNHKTQTIVIPDQMLGIFLKMNLGQYPKSYYLFTNNGVPGPKHVGRNYFGNHFRTLRRKLNLPDDYKMYNWKHTGNVMASKAGIPTKEIQLHDRHYSLDATDKYLSSMTATESTALRNKFPSIAGGK